MQAEKKTPAMQWIDGPDKTGSDGVGDEDLGAKPGKYESVGRREAPHLNIQELELKQQPASQGHKQETQEAPPNLGEETREAPSDPEEETREAPSDLQGETREASSDPNVEAHKMPLDSEETQESPPDPEEETPEARAVGSREGNAGGAVGGSMDLEGPVVPALQMLIISGNLPPNNATAHVESTGARRRGKSSAANVSAIDQQNRRGSQRRERVGMRRRGLDDFAGKGEIGVDNGGHVIETKTGSRRSTRQI